MSEQVAEATQADAPDQSQVDTPNQQTESQADEVQAISLDEAKKLRSEAQGLRKRLKEAETKVSSFETANQSEEERRSAEYASLQERADRAEQDLRAANARSDVFSKAGNTTDAELLYLYVEKQGIEFDDDGKPTNIEALITQAREKKPTLFQRGSADGAAKPPSKTNDFNSAFRTLAREN